MLQYLNSAPLLANTTHPNKAATNNFSVAFLPDCLCPLSCVVDESWASRLKVVAIQQSMQTVTANCTQQPLDTASRLTNSQSSPPSVTSFTRLACPFVVVVEAEVTAAVVEDSVAVVAEVEAEVEEASAAPQHPRDRRTE